jgi:hypothetical protein
LPRSGSGVYTLPDTIQPATLADANEVQAINVDIASALTGSVASDGQTPITGQLRGFVSATPGYSFNGDLNTGFGSDVPEEAYIQANGTKTVRVTAAGITVTGTMTLSGLLTVATGGVAITAGVFTAPVGSAGAPSYTFAGDLNSGFYWIGADNIGAAVNGAKVLDIATTGLGITGAITATTNITATAAINGATVAGAMVATQANMETGTATNLIVTPGRQVFHPKHTKAWCRFSGTGTPAVTSGSGVSSITDNGVGDYTINWTTAFASATDYAWLAMPSEVAGGSTLAGADRTAGGAAAAPIAGAVRLTTFAFPGGAAVDPGRIYVAAWGDLS